MSMHEMVQCKGEKGEGLHSASIRKSPYNGSNPTGLYKL